MNRLNSDVDPNAEVTKVLIIWIITAVACTSVILGLKNGIRKLSKSRSPSDSSYFWNHGRRQPMVLVELFRAIAGSLFAMGHATRLGHGHMARGRSHHAQYE